MALGTCSSNMVTPKQSAVAKLCGRWKKVSGTIRLFFSKNQPLNKPKSASGYNNNLPARQELDNGRSGAKHEFMYLSGRLDASSSPMHNASAAKPAEPMKRYPLLLPQ